MFGSMAGSCPSESVFRHRLTSFTGVTLMGSGQGDNTPSGHASSLRRGGDHGLARPPPSSPGAWAVRPAIGAVRSAAPVPRVYDTTDLTTKALLAAQQGNAPDVLVVDNPVISTLAEAGVLATTDEVKLDVSEWSRIFSAPGNSTGRPMVRRLARTPSPCVLQQGGAPGGEGRYRYGEGLVCRSPRPWRRSRRLARRASPSRRSARRRAASSSCHGSGAPGRT